MRINSLATLALLLTLLLIYDVFWVFTSKVIFGESVMESVATKVLSLPMSIQFGHYFTEGWSGLGNGDIVLPGVFICQLYFLDKHHGFDHSNQLLSLRGAGYFKMSMLLYLFSLVLSLAVVIIFHKGQPALLYIGRLVVHCPRK
ncbi:hypothetical protein SAMD00019534_033150 [Acytostelium subglobosum LB1]|uniref:hypothetical protein n=1 Tax=Acytostelium subglobosum LB1 TaxID=1410327 RepID=UPI0006449D1D|nr:hypothetical protein SAMD00019534_033150 [Acytostelium subglobosum LB1]GAM20140.1 hypothetical protein SAMD00019534_033150 [Acytostelium subglobosum LB1]|eukprot:XP_012759661.1 hypothetical protein SAMD00019534_033150 [Acytostelium subglobosum LB1]